VLAIPADTVSELFGGVSIRPGYLTHNRSHSVFYDVLSSGGLSGLGLGNRFIVADTIVRIATPKQVVVSCLQLMRVNLAFISRRLSKCTRSWTRMRKTLVLPRWWIRPWMPSLVGAMGRVCSIGCSG
jgi:hypothetical protein